jgi:hypothetical protein
VNLYYADAACNGRAFYYVESVSGCTTEGGWYYDDPVVPENIQLCPTSCEQVSVPGSQMIFSVGCQTLVWVE